MTRHDYKAARRDFDSDTAIVFWLDEETKASIRFALSVADKLMQEPSADMMNAQVNACREALASGTDRPWDISFKAMRDQMLKEVE